MFKRNNTTGKVEKMASAVKPIQHMRVEFEDDQKEKEFLQYAFGEQRADKRTQEITNMIKYYKRAKEKQNIPVKFSSMSKQDKEESIDAMKNE
ncbi:hypothetical protein EBB07_29605 [Paenibacillaceae bacterium]|nr:hypothetical protein EBB07_29605 [Paenibacillaceae bacterium]